MDDPTLHDYLAVLRRRRGVVIVAVYLGVALAMAYSLAQTRRYEARAELLLKRTASQQLLVDERGQVNAPVNAQRALNNEIRVMESRAIRDAVKDAYDGPLDVDIVTAQATAAE